MTTKTKPRPIDTLPTGRRLRGDGLVIPDWVPLPASVEPAAAQVGEAVLALRDRNAEARPILEAAQARGLLGKQGGGRPLTAEEEELRRQAAEAMRVVELADDALNKATRAQNRALADALDEFLDLNRERTLDNRRAALAALDEFADALVQVRLDEARTRAVEEFVERRHWDLQLPRREDIRREQEQTRKEEILRAQRRSPVERELWRLYQALRLEIEPAEAVERVAA